MRSIIFRLFTMCFIASMAIACSSSSETSSSTEEENVLRGEVKVDGSSTVYPITEAVAEEFRAHAPKVRVTIGVSGTGGGFKKFTRGEVDINDASRGIKDKEKALCEENNVKYLELSVAYDGLAVVMHPENDWAKSMTVSELKKLWEPSAQGTITKWNQIRPEWPDADIHLFGPGVASGTYDYFTEAIVGESGASRGDYTASEDDNVLVQGIATDKYALGFFGLAYYEENSDRLELVAVDGGNGKAVKPSLETVKDGTYAPLSRPLFIYISDAGTKRSEVVGFLDFYLDNVDMLVKDVGYIPLQESEYAAEKAKLAAFLAK